MTLQPIIVGSGLSAWTLLKRTLDSQTKVFDASPSIARDTAYFKENIGKINSAEELVKDYRLLRVALGAYGLQDDINNKYFIQKILEDGTVAEDALANRLADTRYREFSRAFGFGNAATPLSKLSDFGTKITAKFRRQEFEVAVGDQNQALRLGLNAERSIGDIATANVTNDTKWLRIMGNPPLRDVFETALGIPASFAQLDLDRQVEIFKDRAESQFGSDEVAIFAEEEDQKKLIQRFLVRSQVEEIQSASTGNIVVTLLQGAADFARSWPRL